MRRIIAIIEIITIYLIGFLMGVGIKNENNIRSLKSEINKQIEINKQLKTEYDTLKINYDDLDIDLHQQIKVCEEKGGE